MVSILNCEPRCGYSTYVGKVSKDFVVGSMIGVKHNCLKKPHQLYFFTKTGGETTFTYNVNQF